MPGAVAFFDTNAHSATTAGASISTFRLTSFPFLRSYKPKLNLHYLPQLVSETREK